MSTSLRSGGPNFFDFEMGDFVEARFPCDCYKLDSANERFLRVTGIADLLSPLSRETVIPFLKSLNLPFTLREINRGIYTYCSKTEGWQFGFCQSRQDCGRCGVADLCAKRL